MILEFFIKNISNKVIIIRYLSYILSLALVPLFTTFSSTNFQKDNKRFIEVLKSIPISIVAPSSAIDSSTLNTIKNIPSLTLEIPSGCFDKTKVLFHSHNDQVRFKCLQNALFDDTDHVIWAVRGGYGAAKLIPYLKTLTKPNKEKLFIGFSDITALHIFFSQEWGWRTIHGNCFSEILKSDKDRSNFKKIADIVTGKVKQVIISDLIPINDVVSASKIIKGKLTGGNLTIVQTSIGTIWQIKTADKILFLEDVALQPYQVDRALYHLKQAGLLNDVSAIIFGSFNPDDQNIISVLKNFAVSLTIPVFKTNRFGHGKFNDPIIYNTNSEIIKNDSGNFSLIMKLDFIQE